MKEISIPFNKWSELRIIAHNKKATSRYKKYGEIGDIFRVGKFIFKLDLVEKLSLQLVAEELYHTEGADSPEEFIEVWEDIHKRRGYRPNDQIWYHHFKEVKNDQD